jgi:hypothetical protein
MNKFIPLVVLVALIGVLITGCSLIGSGPIVEKAYDFTDFTEIEISHDFQYDISRADTFSLTVSTHENLVKSLDVSKSGHTLTIGFRPDNIANSDGKAVITLPQLEGLQVSGASKGKVSGFASSRDFDLQVSGASQADIDMEAGNTRIDVSGASKVTGNLKAGDTRIKATGASHCDLEGSAGRTDITVSGASGVNSPDLIIQDTSVEISGASSAAIKTAGILDISLSGASTLNYYGNPKLGKVDISGASQMHQK